MATKEKLFKRGVGFTFTPSRVPDEGDVDYIDELNVLLQKSNLSQNKFLEVMLKDAIEYAKLKNSGSLTVTSGAAQPLINHEADSQSSPIAAEIPEISKESDNAHLDSHHVQPSFSDNGLTSKETKADEVSAAKSNSQTSPDEIDPVIKRAMERANRAKLKPL
ncbi:hypothetical protein [Paenibacillus sp. Y412MC10]|uniref:hypothetical protein n=1 Tax=Geobacillus sp. (strain Y412MC10) TaxID=481743 RepID=UPI0011AB4888|nr:hypothetical protein [Paenibacillus sp. Y412MC10]